MSDVLVADARPRKDYSSAAFHREAALLQHRFATLAESGVITKPKLICAMCRIPSYLYWSDAPLTDRYVPQAVVYFKASRGKIAIVFPGCGDRMLDDGTITDRHLTIHFIAEAEVRDMTALFAEIVRALTEIPRGDLPESEFEPCGFARLG